jgi:hypothetical protein
MKIPAHLEDPYVKEVLYNTSLEDLPGEKWKEIENFGNYKISNYGRIKSLERWVILSNGREQKRPELIMKLTFQPFFNNHLHRKFYNIHCSLASEGKKYHRSVPRLVYYHFIEKFDLDDDSIVISYKDDNRFHIHSRNLEKLSVSQAHFKRFRTDRAKNHRSDYSQAVSQYTVEGELVNTFESINQAKDILGIGCRNIFTVISKKGLTAGGFRWFLKDYSPTKEDFIPETKEEPDRLLNRALWEKLGRPPIDEMNPPACMNISLKDLPGEKWKPLKGLERQFAISNKGRIKRLNSWTQATGKTFLREHIVSLLLDVQPKNKSYYIYARLNHNGKRPRITVTRLLYYSFVEPFDMEDKTLFVVNGNEHQWNLDIAKLSLQSIHSVFNNKRLKKDKK